MTGKGNGFLDILRRYPYFYSFRGEIQEYMRNTFHTQHGSTHGQMYNDL